MGGLGVFTREIQHALLADEIDLAVHSLKDLPTDPTDGLFLAAVPSRAVVQDVLVLRDPNLQLHRLPTNARIGTGSIRRRAQLLYLRGDLEILDIRGNVDTRLKKLDAGQYDGIVLAEAGLSRLGLADRITQRFTPTQMLPAVGQGPWESKSCADDARLNALLEPLNDPLTNSAVTAERTMLSALCRLPGTRRWISRRQQESVAAGRGCVGRQRPTSIVRFAAGCHFISRGTRSTSCRRVTPPRRRRVDPVPFPVESTCHSERSDDSFTPNSSHSIQITRPPTRPLSLEASYGCRRIFFESPLPHALVSTMFQSECSMPACLACAVFQLETVAIQAVFSIGTSPQATFRWKNITRGQAFRLTTNLIHRAKQARKGHEDNFVDMHAQSRGEIPQGRCVETNAPREVKLPIDTRVDGLGLTAPLARQRWQQNICWPKMLAAGLTMRPKMKMCCSSCVDRRDRTAV